MKPDEYHAALECTYLVAPIDRIYRPTITATGYAP